VGHLIVLENEVSQYEESKLYQGTYKLLIMLENKIKSFLTFFKLK